MSWILLAAALVLPWVWNGALFWGTNFSIWGLLALSWNLLYGYTGLLSLGLGVYFALGAYGAAFAVMHAHTDFGTALIAGIALALLVALLLGWGSVRLSGYGFVVGTLVTALIFYLLALGTDHLTGGEDGLSFRAPPLSLVGVEFPVSDLSVRYYLALAALVVGWSVVRSVISSPLGLALRVVRENEQRAAFLGYDVLRLKWVSFAMAGALAGLAGAVWALSKEYVRAGLFQPFGAFVSAQPEPDPLIAVLLGGAGTLWGPLWGTAILLALRETVVGLWPQGYALTMGIVILAIVRYRPQGLISLFKRSSSPSAI
jgi:branched-chain amino acid transport system permease protein